MPSAQLMLAIQQTFSNMLDQTADMRQEINRGIARSYACICGSSSRDSAPSWRRGLGADRFAARWLIRWQKCARPTRSGAAVYPIAYNTFTPASRRALNEYLLAGPGKDFSFGLFPALMGLLGAPTKYEQLSSGDYRPVFVGDQLYGSFGEGPFGGLVYTGLPLPSDVAAEYGIPGFEEEDDDDEPEITGTVQDPMTGQEKCPDGYIFDEDLQACRLETKAPVAAPLEARSPTRTYSLLDQAPDGLLEFQRRFGLPEQQMDFSLLT